MRDINGKSYKKQELLDALQGFIGELEDLQQQYAGQSEFACNMINQTINPKSNNFIH
ncbi:hypothetical protein [Moraxella lincolnii]|uniref:hypothetical protein n=1 Tax=Lwoffella lincolnii TaxID=90241 RepID=UPI0013016A42|nr:hypothetical protein [Moraxella lincolnii]